MKEGLDVRGGYSGFSGAVAGIGGGGLALWRSEGVVVEGGEERIVARGKGGDLVVVVGVFRGALAL